MWSTLKTRFEGKPFTQSYQPPSLSSMLYALFRWKMFGARVVRQKRERERAERELLDLDGRQTIPYIKPFGERFDPSQLPYFKYRKALAELELERGACLEVKLQMIGLNK